MDHPALRILWLFSFLSKLQLFRRYIKKGTDFHAVSEFSVRLIERKINNRPKKVLDYNTPDEYLAIMMAAA